MKKPRRVYGGAYGYLLDAGMCPSFSSLYRIRSRTYAGGVVAPESQFSMVLTGMPRNSENSFWVIPDSVRMDLAFCASVISFSLSVSSFIVYHSMFASGIFFSALLRAVLGAGRAVKVFPAHFAPFTRCPPFNFPVGVYGVFVFVVVRQALLSVSFLGHFLPAVRAPLLQAPTYRVGLPAVLSQVDAPQFPGSARRLFGVLFPLLHDLPGFSAVRAVPRTGTAHKDRTARLALSNQYRHTLMHSFQRVWAANHRPVIYL